uniref:F-box domain-containing protein n=1 Tax=Populus trichocarpa TaxID=3694 RepID=B9H5U7_POPTR
MERLCEDLIDEILLCLPIKSVVRFRCLSKDCNQLVSDLRFATNHALLSIPEVHGISTSISSGSSQHSILFCLKTRTT